jgi:hypothetical protein
MRMRVVLVVLIGVPAIACAVMACVVHCAVNW